MSGYGALVHCAGCDPSRGHERRAWHIACSRPNAPVARAFEFKADVPGIDAKDIDVKLTNNRLSISGKREAEKSDKGETYYNYERSYGSFVRSFTLPDGVNVEAIQADLKDGVLKIVLPKNRKRSPVRFRSRRAEYSARPLGGRAEPSFRGAV